MSHHPFSFCQTPLITTVTDHRRIISFFFVLEKVETKDEEEEEENTQERKRKRQRTKEEERLRSIKKTLSQFLNGSIH